MLQCSRGGSRRGSCITTAAARRRPRRPSMARSGMWPDAPDCADHGRDPDPPDRVQQADSDRDQGRHEARSHHGGGPRPPFWGVVGGACACAPAYASWLAPTLKKRERMPATTVRPQCQPPAALSSDARGPQSEVVSKPSLVFTTRIGKGSMFLPRLSANVQKTPEVRRGRPERPRASPAHHVVKSAAARPRQLQAKRAAAPHDPALGCALCAQPSRRQAVLDALSRPVPPWTAPLNPHTGGDAPKGDVPNGVHPGPAHSQHARAAHGAPEVHAPHARVQRRPGSHPEVHA
jgi:hypothetical protein